MPAAPPAPGAAETPAPRPATAAPADTALPRQDRAAAALELQAQGATWVQVVGASGRVWLQRTLQGGETLRFDEDLPLAVTVGRADVTLVRVRGQALDLGPYTRNQVARFDVR
jgi:cytoskeleton protein RodZ